MQLCVLIWAVFLSSSLNAKTSKKHANITAEGTCLNQQQLLRLGFTSDITQDALPAPVCGDIHLDFGSCVNPVSFEHSFEEVRTRLVSNYTNNLLSLSRSASFFIEQAEALLGKFSQPEFSEVVSQEHLQRINSSIVAFGNVSDFSLEMERLSNDTTCLEVQKSLLLTSLCLVTSKNISQPFLDMSNTNSLTVTRPLPDIVVAACKNNLAVTCKINDLLEALAPFSDEKITNDSEKEACQQFRALQRCEEKKRVCPKYGDRVFEAFFRPNTAILTHSLSPMNDVPVSERFFFRVNETGLPVHDYLFESVRVLGLLAISFLALLA